MIQAKAPGKLILSGEHAVVYGNPALAMAIDRYVTVTLKRALLPTISFEVSELSHKRTVTLDTLGFLKNRIKNKYQKFVSGEYRISQVLQKPFELLHVAFGMFQDAVQIKAPHGVKINVQSQLPI